MGPYCMGGSLGQPPSNRDLELVAALLYSPPWQRRRRGAKGEEPGEGKGEESSSSPGNLQFPLQGTCNW